MAPQYYQTLKWLLTYHWSLSLTSLQLDITLWNALHLDFGNSILCGLPYHPLLYAKGKNSPKFYIRSLFYCLSLVSINDLIHSQASIITSSRLTSTLVSVAWTPGSWARDHELLQRVLKSKYTSNTGYGVKKLTLTRICFANESKHFVI